MMLLAVDPGLKGLLIASPPGTGKTLLAHSLRSILPKASSDSSDSGTGEGPLYVQVSVSRNATWSQQMADELTRAGLAAKVLPPATVDEGFRVVLGPYNTREQAEGIGRKLGRPYWIYHPGQ